MRTFVFIVLALSAGCVTAKMSVSQKPSDRQPTYSATVEIQPEGTRRPPAGN